MIITLGAYFAIEALCVGLFAFYHTPRHADAAIVLGAAVWGDVPSPVFRERLNHAADLQRKGVVRHILVTGGVGKGKNRSEGAVGRDYLLTLGIPSKAILTEEDSRTTFENLRFAQPVAEAAGFKTILLVSDPLHMRRAMLYARQLRMTAYSAPTPSTCYTSFASIAPFLLAETYYIIRDYWRGFIPRHGRHNTLTNLAQ